MSDVKKTRILTSPDNAIEEVRQFSQTMRMADLYRRVHKGGDIDDKTRKELEAVIISYAELFSVEVPDMAGMTFDTVLTISNQEIKVARLLRERGLFRLAQAIRMTDENGIPLWTQLVDENDEPFERQEDVIHAFCTASHISRQTVFTRLSLYRMLEFIGFTSEEAYKLILQHPTLLYKTLLKIGDWGWGKNSLSQLDEEVVRSIMRYYDCDEVMFDLLEDASEGGAESHNQLVDKLKPVLRQMVEDTVEQPNSKEASIFVGLDVMAGNMVNYYWDTEEDALVIEIDAPIIDETGSIVDRRKTSLRMYADSPTGGLPEEAKRDLIERLPIKNRKEIV
jgi:hypothetical protein